MKKYDIKCPICGAVNKNLNLDETGGWMECDSCHNTVGLIKYMKLIRIPFYKDLKTVHPLNLRG